MLEFWLLMATLFPVLAYSVTVIDPFEKNGFLPAGKRQINGGAAAESYMPQWPIT